MQRAKEGNGQRPQRKARIFVNNKRTPTTIKRERGAGNLEQGQGQGQGPTGMPASTHRWGYMDGRM